MEASRLNGSDGLSASLSIPSALATSVGAAVMFVFLVEGLLGNLWIVIAVACNKKVWNVINMLIASLCLNDLLMLCLVVLLILDSYIWRGWTASLLMCKLHPEFNVAFTGCSLWHSAFIAIHRYIVVVHNGLYKQMSKKGYVAFVLLATRIIPFAATFPGFSMQTSDYVPKMLRCIFLPSQKVRIISVTVIQIIVPCVVVILCYIAIFAYVVRMSRHMTDSNMVMQREIQITKMFGVIFLMILLGFVPYGVIRNMDSDNTFSADVYVAVSVFYAIATCSNPLVYGVMSTDIRSACWTSLKNTMEVCHCRPCLKDSQGSRPMPLSKVIITDSIKKEKIKLSNGEEKGVYTAMTQETHLGSPQGKTTYTPIKPETNLTSSQPSAV